MRSETKTFAPRSRAMAPSSVDSALEHVGEEEPHRRAGLSAGSPAIDCTATPMPSRLNPTTPEHPAERHRQIRDAPLGREHGDQLLAVQDLPPSEVEIPCEKGLRGPP
jgi:hypothetical protein